VHLPPKFGRQIVRADTWISPSCARTPAMEYLPKSEGYGPLPFQPSHALAAVTEGSRADLVAPPRDEQEVWLYLLQVLAADRTDELSSVRQKYIIYSNMDHETSMSRRIMSECQRYYQRRVVARAQLGAPASSAAGTASGSSERAAEPDFRAVDWTYFSTTCEKVVGTWLNRNRHVEYFPALVHICAPFIFCLKTEAGIFFCFDRVMSMSGAFWRRSTWRRMC
jgi:hypothetical protein